MFDDKNPLCNSQSTLKLEEMDRDGMGVASEIHHLLHRRAG